MDFLEELFEPQFQSMILGASEELAKKVTTSLERIVAKGQAGHTKILM